MKIGQHISITIKDEYLNYYTITKCTGTIIEVDYEHVLIRCGNGVNRFVIGTFEIN